MDEKRLRKLAGLEILNENLFDIRGITADRFSDLSREITRSVQFAGGKFDPDSDAFDRSLEKKAIQLMKKLQQKADDVRKVVKQLSKLG